MGADNWADCEAACVSDVVTSGAKRWAKMCASRQETLIDQGKEAVKSLVADGLAARMQRKLVAQFIVGALIIVLGLAYAYRRRLVTARIAYRLQKRCLMGRKNSDLNLPV